VGKILHIEQSYDDESPQKKCDRMKNSQKVTENLRHNEVADTEKSSENSEKLLRIIISLYMKFISHKKYNLTHNMKHKQTASNLYH